MLRSKKLGIYVFRYIEEWGRQSKEVFPLTKKTQATKHQYRSLIKVLKRRYNTVFRLQIP